MCSKLQINVCPPLSFIMRFSLFHFRTFIYPDTERISVTFEMWKWLHIPVSRWWILKLILKFKPIGWIKKIEWKNSFIIWKYHQELKFGKLKIVCITKIVPVKKIVAENGVFVERNMDKTKPRKHSKLKTKEKESWCWFIIL